MDLFSLDDVFIYIYVGEDVHGISKFINNQSKVYKIAVFSTSQSSNIMAVSKLIHFQLYIIGFSSEN